MLAMVQDDLSAQGFLLINETNCNQASFDSAHIHEKTSLNGTQMDRKEKRNLAQNNTCKNSTRLPPLMSVAPPSVDGDSLS